jgi:hypothetical protein
VLGPEDTVVNQTDLALALQKILSGVRLASCTCINAMRTTENTDT